MPEWGVWGLFCLFGSSALVAALYPLRASKAWVLGLLPVFGLFVCLGYALWGGWPAWRAFQATERKQAEAEQVMRDLGSLEAVVDRLKAHLAKAPQDAKGWFLLGRVYVSAGDWKQAHAAYTIAHGLEPGRHEYTLHYAQSVWELHHQAFDGETRTLLQAILNEDAHQPDALAMLAFDAYNTGHRDVAVAYWERLLQQTDASSDEAIKLRQAIAKARMQIDAS